MNVRVIHGDMRDVVPTLSGIDACVTDPPYELGFMGRAWDRTGIAFQPETWRLVLDAMKPGAHLVAFGGTRTFHRMACAIEDAGFEIRDTFCWLYGSGFPKSLDVSKALDKAAGARREVTGNTSETSGRTVGHGTSAGYHGNIVSGHCRDITAPATPEAATWAGWHTALKPAFEPIICARKEFTAVPHLGSLVESTTLIEALLWSIASVKFVDLCFASSQSEVRRGSVRWLAVVLDTALSAGSSAVTDMFNSPEAASTFLSIAWLWNAILDAICSRPSMFTTEMASSLTTGLRTLNSWISAIIPGNIIQDAIGQNGLWSSANSVDGNSNASPLSFSHIQKPSATESVSQHTIQSILFALADIAEASSPLHRATIADIVRIHVPIEQAMRPSDSERSASARNVAQLLNLPCDSLQSIVAGNVWPLPTVSPNATPIILARKPLIGTVAANVLAHGTGAINVDACRVPGEPTRGSGASQSNNPTVSFGDMKTKRIGVPNIINTAGRWPSNVIHDGSDEVEAAFAAFGDKGGGFGVRGGSRQQEYGMGPGGVVGFGDSGTASRFFTACKWTDSDLRFHYSGKADADDRAWSRHPTIKPLSLMRWLCRLITPPGGTILDPFAGSGTTGEAARLEGFNAILIEREAEYVADINRRLGRASGDDTPLFSGGAGA